jgi:beta-glucosidase-like glycosyl hydrolase/CubicO group peptidase (beta-lactamase class C family)
MIYRVTVLLFFIYLSSYSNVDDPLLTKDYMNQNRWVDSLYSTLSLKQKIGQLFFVQAFSNKTNSHEQEILNDILDNNIGGIIFSNGSAEKQIVLTNKFQNNALIPLLIGMDAEWGLKMRLDSTFAFPWNMTLGAVQDNNLIKQVGTRIAFHANRIGVNFNFAPVVDINTNPNNPIIGNRSFGEDVNNVSEKSLNFMLGQMSMNVLSSAKHFPGHGDTSKDSHKTLPVINHSKERIYNTELIPFKYLIKNGLESIMIAHLEVPALESKKGLPSTLSYSIVTDLLKNELGFKGLIITDALEMKGLSNFKANGNLDMLAFKAGNDILLMSENVNQGIESIIYEYKKGNISENRLAYSVKKILKAKYKVGLHKRSRISLDNLNLDIMNTKDELLNENLIEKSITVIKNNKNILPIKDLKEKIGYMHLGNDSGDYFLKSLNKYVEVDDISGVFKNNSIKTNFDYKSMLNPLKEFTTIIIGVHADSSNPWKSYTITPFELNFIRELSKNKKVILDVFGSPYILNKFKNFTNIESIVVSYQNSKLFQQKSAQIIFGSLNSSGKLPVSIKNQFVSGKGILFNNLNRLSYGIPESVGVNSVNLKKIDSMAKLAIDSLMTPGLQILIAKDGKVIYNKNFGYLTYKNTFKVNHKTIYDVASLTKIMVTLPIIMKLVEDGELSLDSKLKDIITDYEFSNKSDKTIREILSHHANLKSWIPFYKSTLDSVTGLPNIKYYNKNYSKDFNIRVTDNLYLISSFKDSIRNIIKISELNKNKYKYSDLPYYMLKEYIENYYSSDLEYIINSQIYNKMGLTHTSYYPKTINNLNNIAPSEIDDYFRFQEIRGAVHDMGAAMQGGIGGHAGLFSNANDVAKIMQMYIQNGNYGGNEYLQKSTIDLFNYCYYCEKDNRRGVGFDKPQKEDDGPTCGCVSMNSFGHSGWTGTYTWADPDKKIVYVFMSNRSYPNSNDNKLLKSNLRTNIQKIIYNSLIN